MKRGLKLELCQIRFNCLSIVRTQAPMKRGLKHRTASYDSGAVNSVRTQAPMKRGLKPEPCHQFPRHSLRPNPGPDEEGIET